MVAFPFGFLPTFYPDRLGEPMKVKKPSRIFVSDMGDLWGDWVPREWIEAVLDTVKKCPQHTFLMLTKNPKRYQEFEIPDNAWIGTTCEDNSKLYRVGELLSARASLYWVSHEPAMGQLNIEKHLVSCKDCGNRGSTAWVDYDHDLCQRACTKRGEGPSIGWFVVGSMSGPNAVPMDEDWIRHERNACVECGVPFFYKQKIVNGKKVEMPELDGRVWDQYPKVER
jgi:protein gp37